MLGYCSIVDLPVMWNVSRSDTGRNLWNCCLGYAALNGSRSTHPLAEAEEFLNKFAPFKIKLVQELGEDHPDWIVHIFEEMRNGIENLGLLSNLCFSDKFIFYLDVALNKQSCRYWDHLTHLYSVRFYTQYTQKRTTFIPGNVNKYAWKCSWPFEKKYYRMIKIIMWSFPAE